MPGGQPKKFKTPEELERKVAAYFKKADKQGGPLYFFVLGHTFRYLERCIAGV